MNQAKFALLESIKVTAYRCSTEGGNQTAVVRCNNRLLASSTTASAGSYVGLG